MQSARIIGGGWLAVCSLFFVQPAGAEAPGPAQPAPTASPLGCSIEGLGSDRAQARFCQALGVVLERDVRPLSDAREQTDGEAVQVFYTDMQLIVALLREGALAGWTRISRSDNPKAHLNEVARAVRALRQKAHARRDPCTRMELGKSRRGAAERDVLFPWAEFAHCESHMLELVEPWE